MKIWTKTGSVWRGAASAAVAVSLVATGAGSALADPPPPPATTQAKPPAKNVAPKKDAPKKDAPKKDAPKTTDKSKPDAKKPAAKPGPPATVTKVQWFNAHRVGVWVHSPAMNTDVQVQILLARDWFSNPTAKFPQLTMLDGLRAQDDQNGWLINTKVEQFYQDKNVNVVLPVGGESSFYTDWKSPDRGKNYQWETFLIHELPPILEGQWRSTDVRGVEGLSMGGSAAMMLAARNPGFYKFAGSFSGILQLSTYGMPQAIQFALRDGGGYDSAKMFGPPTDPAWKEHDPYMLANKLRGTSLYISSGNGMVGPHDKPSDIPMLATNYSGVGLEVLSRVTSQQFAAKLGKLGINGQAVYRPSGTHTWPYWEFEMQQAWPQAASALGIAGDKVACEVGDAFKKAPQIKGLGGCLTPEYAVPGGRAQDFRNGRIFTGPDGPKVVGGAIGGVYVAEAERLGLPTSDELTGRDGVKYNTFERGKIVFTPQTGARVE